VRASWTEFLIGTCVLIVAIGFVVVGFQRGGWSSDGKTYTLNASFRSVEGVSVGTDVRMAGVNVGKVSDI
jgi:phospholipid/cholesterol/gamma-HCH transport system substrate-binding protein